MAAIFGGVLGLLCAFAVRSLGIGLPIAVAPDRAGSDTGCARRHERRRCAFRRARYQFACACPREFRGRTVSEPLPSRTDVRDSAALAGDVGGIPALTMGSRYCCSGSNPSSRATSPSVVTTTRIERGLSVDAPMLAPASTRHSTATSYRWLPLTVLRSAGLRVRPRVQRADGACSFGGDHGRSPRSAAHLRLHSGQAAATALRRVCVWLRPHGGGAESREPCRARSSRARVPATTARTGADGDGAQMTRWFWPQQKSTSVVPVAGGRRTAADGTLVAAHRAP